MSTSYTQHRSREDRSAHRVSNVPRILCVHMPNTVHLQSCYVESSVYIANLQTFNIKVMWQVSLSMYVDFTAADTQVSSRAWRRGPGPVLGVQRVSQTAGGNGDVTPSSYPYIEVTHLKRTSNTLSFIHISFNI